MITPGGSTYLVHDSRGSLLADSWYGVAFHVRCVPRRGLIASSDSRQAGPSFQVVSLSMVGLISCPKLPTSLSWVIELSQWLHSPIRSRHSTTFTTSCVAAKYLHSPTLRTRLKERQTV